MAGQPPAVGTSDFWATECHRLISLTDRIRKRSTGRQNCLAAAVAGVIELAAADLQPPVMTSLLLAAAGVALEVLAAAVGATVVATTAVATTEAVAEYTPQTGQRRRRGRKGSTGNGGRAAKDSQDHRPWPVIVAVHRPLAAGASGLRGQVPSGVSNISESHWVAGTRPCVTSPLPATNIPEAKCACCPKVG